LPAKPGVEREREREMCRRCRRIYIRHPPGARRSPSHLSLSDSRENNPSPCDPALSPTSLTSACNRSQGPTQTQSISMPPSSRGTSRTHYKQKRLTNASRKRKETDKPLYRAKQSEGLIARYGASALTRVSSVPSERPWARCARQSGTERRRTPQCLPVTRSISIGRGTGSFGRAQRLLRDGTAPSFTS
jgi:hypothetical protein